ncbi:hypothetical protein Godav_026009, partial [Gossypium davidsonii]|nr:hypothetical protein [Gossypium davidsonii]
MDEASNMKVVLKHYESGSPQETDMLLTARTIKLKYPVTVVKKIYYYPNCRLGGLRWRCGDYTPEPPLFFGGEHRVMLV